MPTLSEGAFFGAFFFSIQLLQSIVVTRPRHLNQTDMYAKNISHVNLGVQSKGIPLKFWM